MGDVAETKAELDEVAAADAVNEESKSALSNALAGKMAKQKMDNMDAAEQKAELAEVEALDAVNEESKAGLAAKLAGKMAKQKMDNMDAEETKAELAEVEAVDAVNEDSKANLAAKLAGKMAKQKQDNMDAEETKAELADVEALDAVNEESKSNLAAKLAGKMAKQKQDNMDVAETKAELDDVAAADAVNEESKANLANALAGKMAKQKMDNMDAAEQKAELAEVEAMDAVNEESKANLANKLAAISKKEPAEEEVESAVSPSTPKTGGKFADYEKYPNLYLHGSVKEELKKLIAEPNSCRHVICKTGKGSSKKRSMGELCSSGPEGLSALLNEFGSEEGKKSIYFAWLSVKAEDPEGSARERQVYFKFIGSSCPYMIKAKVNGYMGDMNSLLENLGGSPSHTFANLDETQIDNGMNLEALGMALLKAGGAHPPAKFIFSGVDETPEMVWENPNAQK